MANHKSAKKRIKQSKSKRALNRMKISRTRTSIKKFRQAITTKDKDAASKLFTETQSLLAKLYKTGQIKKNNFSRKVSRLAVQVSAL